MLTEVVFAALCAPAGSVARACNTPAVPTGTQVGKGWGGGLMHMHTHTHTHVHPRPCCYAPPPHTHHALHP